MNEEEEIYILNEDSLLLIKKTREAKTEKLSSQKCEIKTMKNHIKVLFLTSLFVAHK